MLEPIEPMDIRAFLDRLVVPDLPEELPLGQEVTLILDRAGQKSHDYKVCGTTACIDCGHTVLLGTRTFDVVVSGRAIPLCLPCSRQLAWSRVLSDSIFMGKVEDT